MSRNQPRRPGSWNRADLDITERNYKYASRMKGIYTHKSNFATIKPWFRREPLPHEGAGRIVVHRVDETSDVVVD